MIKILKGALLCLDNFHSCSSIHILYIIHRCDDYVESGFVNLEFRTKTGYLKRRRPAYAGRPRVSISRILYPTSPRLRGTIVIYLGPISLSASTRFR